MLFPRPLSKYIVLYFLFYIFIFTCFACTTLKTRKDTPEQPFSSTILPLPTAAELTLNRIDPQVLADLEIASPVSIRRAVNRIYSISQGLTQSKQFQLTLAARLMHFVYPLEPIDWNVPSYRQADPYLDALAQIEKNVYPQNLGRSVFWDAVIPTIILTKEIGIQEYVGSLENRLMLARNFNPASVLPSYLLGLLYEQLGKLSDAENYYQTAWKQDDSCYPAGMRLAYLSMLHNDIETADRKSVV